MVYRSVEKSKKSNGIRRSTGPVHIKDVIASFGISNVGGYIGYPLVYFNGCNSRTDR